MTKLHQEAAVIQMALELRLDWRDPVNAVVRFCQEKISRWVRAKSGVQNLRQLEDLVCGQLHLTFEEIWSDDQLNGVIRKYVDLGEPVFSSLCNAFDEHTYATLLQRRNADASAPDRYVAVVDCRGAKAWRRFFTRWHEIAHLLTLGRQLAFPFHRSTIRDPVERLMDVVAGEVGFYEPLFLPTFRKQLNRNGGRLSFATVESIRSELVPEASFQATLAACVKRMTTPVVYVEAGMGLKKQEERLLRSGRQGRLFPAVVAPKPRLRAITVVPNDAAREAGLRVDPNMQIPEGSIAHFEGIATGHVELVAERSGVENLSIWKHSDGTSLGGIDVCVEARRVKDRAILIIQPAAQASRSRT